MICNAPIIFLDTAILLKASKGVRLFKSLVDLVITLANEGKIIPIEGAQRDEIYHGKDTDGIDILNKHCHATSSLEFIQKKQLFRAVCDYVKNKSGDFTLQLEDIFLHDPSITGTSGLGRITDSEALGIDTDKNLIKQAKLHEVLRQAATDSNIKYQKGREIGLKTLIDFWKNEPYLYDALISDPHKFNEFWDSKFFTSIPFVYLWSSIYSSIITDKYRKIFDETTQRPVNGRKGDWIDLISISTLLPYCDYFTCDLNMKDMVRQISEQDKNDKYFKKMYSSSEKDTTQLIEILGTL
jgi:hypothetical protein